MPIVCPHCTTSYAVKPEAIGANGRTVRCARCKETWHATLEAVPTRVHALAESGGGVAIVEAGLARKDDIDRGQEPDIAAPEHDAPEIDSPPLAAESPEDAAIGVDWTNVAPERLVPQIKNPRRARRLPRLPTLPRFRVNLQVGCAAMASLAAALLIWRADVVKLLPQTAAFYRTIGLTVNLRGIAYKDMKLSTEIADGKALLLIEGSLVATGKKTVELPRLRFVVRDAKGSEIYAWNTVMQQAVLKPGETLPFQSRLASPPDNARSVDVRFFNRRDIAAGGGA